MRTLDRSLPMNDSPMRPPPAKSGTTTTSIVVGSPSSIALSSVRSSSVPGHRVHVGEVLQPVGDVDRSDAHAQRRVGRQRRAGRGVDRDERPVLAPQRHVDAPAPDAGPMRAFGETTADEPGALGRAREVLARRMSAPSPGVVGTLIVLPSARSRISPPLAARPRSSPMATRCDGGGSTSLTSSDRVSPNVRPHWPQMADAAPSSARSASTAPASVPPMAGAPPGRDAHDEGPQRGPQPADRARPASRAGPGRGSSAPCVPRFERRCAPPTSALIDRSGARAGGCGRRRR